MRSALKDTTQRYKSLTGFAIYAIACDISSMRYALRGVKGIYIISQPTAREVISLLSVACMASRENISHLRKQIYRQKKSFCVHRSSASYAKVKDYKINYKSNAKALMAS